MQYSYLWQAQLETAQRAVVEQFGRQGGDVTSLLRHFGFVQPRFESFVSPRRKYVCLYLAIAYLLVFKAADQRNDFATRNRAKKALAAMGGEDALSAGVSTDHA